MTNIWTVRLDHRTYTTQCTTGGYVGIGWLPHDDLSDVTDIATLRALYTKAYPQDSIPRGQRTRTRLLGQAAPDPSYYYSAAEDGCPYRHRRRIAWDSHELSRSEFSVPFQNTHVPNGPLRRSGGPSCGRRELQSCHTGEGKRRARKAPRLPVKVWSNKAFLGRRPQSIRFSSPSPVWCFPEQSLAIAAGCGIDTSPSGRPHSARTSCSYCDRTARLDRVVVT